MTIRITRREVPQAVVVELHGWLTEEALGEFERLCAATEGPLRLDLTHLAGVDEAGLRALRSRRTAGVRLEGASPYVKLLLESER